MYDVEKDHCVQKLGIIEVDGQKIGVEIWAYGNYAPKLRFSTEDRRRKDLRLSLAEVRACIDAVEHLDAEVKLTNAVEGKQKAKREKGQAKQDVLVDPRMGIDQLLSIVGQLAAQVAEQKQSTDAMHQMGVDLGVFKPTVAPTPSKSNGR